MKQSGFGLARYKVLSKVTDDAPATSVVRSDGPRASGGCCAILFGGMFYDHLQPMPNSTVTLPDIIMEVENHPFGVRKKTRLPFRGHAIDIKECSLMRPVLDMVVSISYLGSLLGTQMCRDRARRDLWCGAAVVSRSFLGLDALTLLWNSLDLDEDQGALVWMAMISNQIGQGTDNGIGYSYWDDLFHKYIYTPTCALFLQVVHTGPLFLLIIQRFCSEASKFQLGSKRLANW